MLPELRTVQDRGRRRPERQGSKPSSMLWRRTKATTSTTPWTGASVVDPAPDHAVSPPPEAIRDADTAVGASRAAPARVLPMPSPQVETIAGFTSN